MSRYRSQEEDDARADQFRCPGCETPTRGGRLCDECEREYDMKAWEELDA